jgi:RNA polymerase sigma factor (sigma-70 family)
MITTNANRQPPSELIDLLASIKLGDQPAFCDFYRRTKGFVFAILLGMCRQRAQAEDLLQEVYLSVWRRAGSFDAARGKPMHWLTQIARNAAIDSLRKQRRELPIVWASAEDSDENVFDSMPSPLPGPLEQLIESRQLTELQRQLDGLSERQGQSLRLAFVDGLSYPEIADHLKQPLATVKSWIRRGLMSIRHNLDTAGTASASMEPGAELLLGVGTPGTSGPGREFAPTVF